MASITIALALLGAPIGAPPYDRSPDPATSMQLEGKYNSNLNRPGPSNSGPSPNNVLPASSGTNGQTFEGDPAKLSHSRKLAEIPNVRIDPLSRDSIPSADTTPSPGRATKSGASESARPVWVFVLLSLLAAATAIVAFVLVRSKGE